MVLPSLHGIQVKATETSSIHLENEILKETDSFVSKEVWINAKIRREDPALLFDSSSLKKMVCCDVEAEWGEMA